MESIHAQNGNRAVFEYEQRYGRGEDWENTKKRVYFKAYMRSKLDDEREIKQAEKVLKKQRNLEEKMVRIHNEMTDIHFKYLKTFEKYLPVPIPDPAPRISEEPIPLTGTQRRVSLEY